MALLQRAYQLKREQVDLIKTTICKGATDEELRLFLWVAKRHKLDPLTRQLHAVKRHVKKHHLETRQGENGGTFEVWVPGDQMTIQIGIDGYRSMAARYKDYGGIDEPEFVFAEGARRIPTLARVRVWKKGFEHPSVGTAYWDEYAPNDLDGDKSFMWKRMPKHMLAKCAEALALRKAYPELSDIYVDEEMAQHDQDYTGDGRQIVTADGTAPSGRQIEDKPQTGTHSAAQDVLKQKLEPLGLWCPKHNMPANKCPSDEHSAGELEAFDEAEQRFKASAGAANQTKGASPLSRDAVQDANPVASAERTESVRTAPAEESGAVVELDWIGDPQSPILRGALANILPLLEKHCKMTWGKDGWWHCVPADRNTLIAMSREIGFRLVEVLPKQKSSDGPKSPASVGSGQPSPPSGKPTRGKGQSRPTGTAKAAPALALPTFAGTVERVFVTVKGDKSMAVVTMKGQDGKKHDFGCWDKDIYAILGKAEGKAAEVILTQRGQYTNLTGLKRVHETEYENGKTPILSVNREPGSSKTLWG